MGKVNEKGICRFISRHRADRTGDGFCETFTAPLLPMITANNIIDRVQGIDWDETA